MEVSRIWIHVTLGLRPFDAKLDEPERSGITNDRAADLLADLASQGIKHGLGALPTTSREHVRTVVVEGKDRSARTCEHGASRDDELDGRLSFGEIAREQERGHAPDDASGGRGSQVAEATEVLQRTRSRMIRRITAPSALPFMRLITGPIRPSSARAFPFLYAATALGFAERISSTAAAIALSSLVCARPSVFTIASGSPPLFHISANTCFAAVALTLPAATSRTSTPSCSGATRAPFALPPSRFSAAVSSPMTQFATAFALVGSTPTP